MSLSGDRQDIATAISTVGGVKGHKYRPTVLQTGAGFPLLEAIERDRDFTVTWRVVIVLPTGEERASDWMDQNHELLADAFEDFGYVERIEPGNLATEAGDLDVMILTVRKEA